MPLGRADQGILWPRDLEGPLPIRDLDRTRRLRELRSILPSAPGRRARAEPPIRRAFPPGKSRRTPGLPAPGPIRATPWARVVRSGTHLGAGRSGRLPVGWCRGRGPGGGPSLQAGGLPPTRRDTNQSPLSAAGREGGGRGPPAFRRTNRATCVLLVEHRLKDESGSIVCRADPRGLSERQEEADGANTSVLRTGRESEDGCTRTPRGVPWEARPRPVPPPGRDR